VSDFDALDRATRQSRGPDRSEKARSQAAGFLERSDFRETTQEKGIPLEKIKADLIKRGRLCE